MRRGYRSEHSARDLVQQTFLQLHRGRRDYHAGRPLRPWLMTIARNVLRDRIRYERRRPPAVSLDQALAPEANPGVEHRAELRQEIDAAMEKLPGGLRQLIHARFLDNESLDRIAERLGISKGAAKVRLHRAVSALRGILEEAGHGRP
jgi:RNA polymerase sigma-70 factor (ECF subfamily)